MEYITRDFGKVEIADKDVLTFSQPVFGFDECCKYALLSDTEVGNGIAWLQSLEHPAICFILFDPSHLSAFYTPHLPDNIDSMVGEGELECWTIGVVPDNIEKATVNLKSPIIINKKTQRAAQIILDQDYPVRYPLMKGED